MKQDLKRKVSYANGTEKKYRDGTLMVEEVKRMKGCPYLTLIKKNNLSTSSLPVDFIPYIDNI